MEVVLDNLARELRLLNIELGLVTTKGLVTSEGSSPFDRIWVVQRSRTGRYSPGWWLSTGRRGSWDDWRPDIAIGIGDAAGAFIRRRSLAIPTVIQSHGTPAMEASSAFNSRTVKGVLQGALNLARWPSRAWFYAGASEIWAIGETVRESLASHMGFEQNVVLLPNAVSAPQFVFSAAERAMVRDRLNIPEEARVGLYIGRLDRQKRVDLAIRLAASRSQALDHILIVGRGEDKRRLESLAATEGITDRVHFVGHVDRSSLGSYYSAGDVFLLASTRREGLPVSVLEAAASGLPLVASGSAGVPSEIAAREPVTILHSDSVENWDSTVRRVACGNSRASYLPDEYNFASYGIRHLERIRGLIDAG